MDIYEYADSIGWMADYYDWATGNLYAITKAKEAMETLANKCYKVKEPEIPVYRDGQLIGFAKRNS